VAVTVLCSLCGKPIPEGIRPYRGVHGWERKALAESRRGGSDIVARQSLDEYACDQCIRRLQAGIAPTQESLL
jgi:hypothetical protein